MISVGIDVSKEKSTICILKPYGEVISSPFEVSHTERDLSKLVDMLKKLDGEVRVIMEATGGYHFPILTYLKECGLYVSVINPYVMKKYASALLRRSKTDRLDSIKIANYGIDNWYRLQDYEADEETYKQLKLLGRQYAHYTKLKIESKQSLTVMLDYTMPGIKTLLSYNYTGNSGRNVLTDFAEEYWHFDNITCKSEKQFMSGFMKWAKKNGYRPTEAKAAKIYALAKDGIPTVGSATPSTKMLVMESVRVLREIEKTLSSILSQMQELAMDLKEYPIVIAMNGVGDKLAPRLIAEIGDIRRFHSSKALIAYAGIDAPPFQSGQYTGMNRHISKRGSSTLRKTGYEVMKSLKSNKPPEDAVYQYIVKKETEGKALKVAKIAGLNKFLRIYYARVKEAYL